MFGSTVLIRHRHIQPKSGRTERDAHLGIPSALLVIEAVAQQHGKAVLPFLQLFRYVVGVIPYRLVVVAPQRGKHRLAYLLSIDGKLIETQSTNLRLCFPHNALCLEGLGNDDTAPRQTVNTIP